MWRWEKNWRRRTIIVFFVLCSSWTLRAWGQASEPASGDAPQDEAAAAKDDDSLLSKVTLHGFLSQAYAFSDGNQVIGIPQDGTADYRTAAVQIRADVTDDDTFALQLSHERLGLSPVQALHQDVELDWVFYQRRFGATSIKVGRLPIPYGIYNEIRDVGTALPLYRPARPVYEESSFATETVDGALLAHRFQFGTGWQLEATVHYGNFETFDNLLSPVKADDSVGLELWLDTPLSGLRVGVGGLRFDAVGTAARNATPPSKRQLSHFSIDGNFSRFDVQVEIKRDTAQLAAGGRLASVWAGYSHLGVHLTDKLVAHGEYDLLNVQRPNTELAKDRDRILGLSYRFRPELVLKTEYHWAHGFRVEGQPGLIPGRPVPDYKTQFGILSLATSF